MNNTALAICLLTLGCEVTVQEGMDEDQANGVVVALDAAGIAARKERQGRPGESPNYAVLVGRDELGRSLAVLRAAGLPQESSPGVEEVFAAPSLVPTPAEERARYAAAVSGELAQSIRRWDGVLEARVHLAVPDARAFALDDEPPRPRASVLIKHRAGAAPYADNSVRALVAGAVENMRPEDVAIVSVIAGTAPADTADFVHLGPIAVSRGSAAVLKVFFGGSLILHILMAAGLVWVLRRRRLRGHSTSSVA